ncbi:MAG: hypothetical protein P8P26_01830 [Porticoccaceae bacterium]|nr:hypothetical protein [Porticoccaceae bacterium]
MSVLKIIRLVVLAIAVIGAFVAIPEAALILAVLGLVMGVMGDMADNSNRTYMMVFAVTLATVYGAAGPLPLIGGPVSDIMANMSTIMNAAALGIILNAMKERVME